MLYVSTRNRTDSFTAFRALHEERAPDGGLYVPFRMPALGENEIEALKEQSFGQNVAQILNLFFSARLNGWDVDFCIGRYPVKLAAMNHRLIMAEVWHNHESDYRYMEESLYRKLCGQETGSVRPTGWTVIAIRIAVLFALYGEVARKGITRMDICVAADDFSVPMAAWYARKMGLPLGTIICSGKENGAVWDLIHRGEFSTGANAVCSTEIERLVYETFGLKETLRYVDVCRRNGIYKLSEEVLELLSQGLYACVASDDRVESVLRSIYRTHDYIADFDTALVYGGLQDYRSRTGESCPTLLLAHHSPVYDAERIGAAIGVSAGEIRKRVNNA